LDKVVKFDIGDFAKQQIEFKKQFDSIKIEVDKMIEISIKTDDELEKEASTNFTTYFEPFIKGAS
jgi:hypothetical protein